MATMTSKRKRDDNDMPHMRAAPGMHAPTNDFDEQYLHLDGSMDHPDSGLSMAEMLAQHPGVGGVPDEDAQQHQQHHHQTPQQQQQQQSRINRPLHAGQQQHPSDTAAAAMAQYHTMTIPQSTEQAFMRNTSDVRDGGEGASTPDPASRAQRMSGFHDQKDGEQQSPSGGDTSPNGAPGSGGPKPAVGTDEWHKVRRDNHKEVERRRRETINEGINELAKIVPGCEKNKGSILARAVQFITQLKENETQNIEKWTLEKLLTEQAIAELSGSCDKLKSECQRAWGECEGWRKAAGGGGGVGGGKMGGGGEVGKEDAEGEEED
ncbi:basic helix-loop-helix protein [Friedmanniomyces endolithicus]|nr:basic helix-loop-helix protein [Friedmanniomyces endolithicus]